MKKNTLILFLAITFYSTSVIAQQVEWDYPIKPGSKEWAELKDVDERINSCQIPESVIQKLTVQQLFDLVQSYPFFLSYPLSNSPVDGFQRTMSSFNGYNELMNREGAPELVISFYQKEELAKITNLKSSVERGRYSLKIIAIELLMSEDKFIAMLPESKKMELLKIVDIKNIRKKDLLSEFGGFGTATSAYLGMKLMKSIPSAQGASTYVNEDKFKSFRERLAYNDPQAVEEIITDINRFVKSIPNSF